MRLYRYAGRTQNSQGGIQNPEERGDAIAKRKIRK